LIERIPWSVQLSKHMNMGMRSSVWLPTDIADRCGSGRQPVEREA